MNLLIGVMASVVASACIYVNWSFNIWFWSNYSPEKGASKFKIMFKKAFLNMLGLISMFCLTFYSCPICLNALCQLSYNGKYREALMNIIVFFEFINNLMIEPYFIFFFVFFYIFAFLLSLYLFELIYNEIKNESFLELYGVCIKNLKTGILIFFLPLLYLLFKMSLLKNFMIFSLVFTIFISFSALIELFNYKIFYSGIQKKNFSKLKECMIIYSNTSILSSQNLIMFIFNLIVIYIYMTKFYRNNSTNFFTKFIYFLLFIYNLFMIILYTLIFIGICLLVIWESCFIVFFPQFIMSFYIWIYVSCLKMNDALSELKYNKSYYFEEE